MNQSRALVESGTVLSISPSDRDQILLQSIFASSNWRCVSKPTLAEALNSLTEDVAVVVCERSLPDGTWKELLAATWAMTNPPRLIVTSRYADDELWAEVLNLGGFDVLSKPFHATEVFRVLSLAWRSWHDHGMASYAAVAG